MIHDLIRPPPGSTTGPLDDLHLGSSVWSIYPARRQLVHRFLRPGVRKSIHRSRGRQTYVYVSIQAWSWGH